MACAYACLLVSEGPTAIAPDHGVAPDHGIAPDHGSAPYYGVAPNHRIAPDYGITPNHGVAPNYGVIPDRRWVAHDRNRVGQRVIDRRRRLCSAHRRRCEVRDRK